MFYRDPPRKQFRPVTTSMEGLKRQSPCWISAKCRLWLEQMEILAQSSRSWSFRPSSLPFY